MLFIYEPDLPRQFFTLHVWHMKISIKNFQYRLKVVFAFKPYAYKFKFELILSSFAVKNKENTLMHLNSHVEDNIKVLRVLLARIFASSQSPLAEKCENTHRKS